MKREYYSDSISDFLSASDTAIPGELTRANPFNLYAKQKSAWVEQINILKRVLINRSGQIYFGYAIPRIGKRIDVVLPIGPVFVLEFKVGESHFTSSALDQVTDYCLDLKNFQESSIAARLTPTCQLSCASLRGCLPEPLRSSTSFLPAIRDISK